MPSRKKLTASVTRSTSSEGHGMVHLASSMPLLQKKRGPAPQGSPPRFIRTVTFSSFWPLQNGVFWSFPVLPGITWYRRF